MPDGWQRTADQIRGRLPSDLGERQRFYSDALQAAAEASGRGMLHTARRFLDPVLRSGLPAYEAAAFLEVGRMERDDVAADFGASRDALAQAHRRATAAGDPALLRRVEHEQAVLNNREFGEGMAPRYFTVDGAGRRRELMLSNDERAELMRRDPAIGPAEAARWLEWTRWEAGADTETLDATFSRLLHDERTPATRLDDLRTFRDLGMPIRAAEAYRDILAMPGAGVEVRQTAAGLMPGLHSQAPEVTGGRRPALRMPEPHSTSGAAVIQ